jgi:hypothetical protein
MIAHPKVDPAYLVLRSGVERTRIPDEKGATEPGHREAGAWRGIREADRRADCVDVNADECADEGMKTLQHAVIVETDPFGHFISIGSGKPLL